MQKYKKEEKSRFYDPSKKINSTVMYSNVNELHEIPDKEFKKYL